MQFMILRACSIFLVTVALGLPFTGCSIKQSSTVQHEQVAECPVCRANHDLGCMKVGIADDTPRAQYKDHTFYFCSDECQREFLKHPERYISK